MIDALQQLHLLRPHWLWALALLPLLAWTLRRRSREGSPWRNAVDAHLLPHLIETQTGHRENVTIWLVPLAAALAILALAGPSWEREPQPLWQARAPLVLALDLSGAMQAADMPPSRLAQARAEEGRRASPSPPSATSLRPETALAREPRHRWLRRLPSA